jgi:hypothetical protein
MDMRSQDFGGRSPVIERKDEEEEDQVMPVNSSRHQTSLNMQLDFQKQVSAANSKGSLLKDISKESTLDAEKRSQGMKIVPLQSFRQPYSKKKLSGPIDSDIGIADKLSPHLSSRQFDLDSKLESNDNLLRPKPFIRGGIKKKGNNEILHIFKDQSQESGEFKGKVDLTQLPDELHKKLEMESKLRRDKQFSQRGIPREELKMNKIVANESRSLVIDDRLSKME